MHILYVETYKIFLYIVQCMQTISSYIICAYKSYVYYIVYHYIIQSVNRTVQNNNFLEYSCSMHMMKDSKILCIFIISFNNLIFAKVLPSLQFLVIHIFFIEQISSEMFFCNTCSQALCLHCRTETHKAKMFASHDVINLSKRTKEVHRECCKAFI